MLHCTFSRFYEVAIDNPFFCGRFLITWRAVLPCSHIFIAVGAINPLGSPPHSTVYLLIVTNRTMVHSPAAFAWVGSWLLIRRRASLHGLFIFWPNKPTTQPDNQFHSTGPSSTIKSWSRSVLLLQKLRVNSLSIFRLLTWRWKE
jgi:hypothetical protein